LLQERKKNKVEEEGEREQGTYTILLETVLDIYGSLYIYINSEYGTGCWLWYEGMMISIGDWLLLLWMVQVGYYYVIRD
jgi:hypothetical protein